MTLAKLASYSWFTKTLLIFGVIAIAVILYFVVKINHEPLEVTSEKPVIMINGKGASEPGVMYYQKETPRDYTVVFNGAIAAFLMLGLGFMNKKSDLTNLKYDRYFLDIFAELKNVQTDKTKMETITKLEETLRFYTRVAQCMRLKTFVDAEGLRLMEVVKSIMAEEFTDEHYDSADVKLQSACMEANEQAARQFNKVFAVKYAELQRETVARFMGDLKQITETKVINHQYERFRTATTAFFYFHFTAVNQLYGQAYPAPEKPEKPLIPAMS